MNASAGQGEALHPKAYVESVRGHAPADAIVVADAQFLFQADYKRSGLDLILHKDDHELVLHDYFKGDKHAALASPDGAHLTPELVNALTGSVELAQAGNPAAAAGHVIGHVTKLAGSATAVRNGVSIILNIGDNVEKGDVVQSGSDSTLGITFIDGTVFGLSSNARMVLNEMVYDPNGSNNSSLLSLVAGTITFVAGETAKHGDMKVDTPVATMGIRGTAVLVEIDFDVSGQSGTPDAKFQVLVEPDGTTGSYILFDKTTLQPLAVVNQAGQQINISNGIISQSAAPLSPDVQKLIIDVFSLKFSANDTHPKTTTAQTDTINPQLTGPLIQLADKSTAQPIYQQSTPVTDGSPSITPPTPATVPFRVDGPPTVRVLDSHGNLASSFTLTEIAGKTGDAADLNVVGGQVNFVDPNAGDQPTVSVALAHLTLYDSKHQQIADLDAAHLPGNGPAQINDLIAAGIAIHVVPASTNHNNGSASWTYSIADQAFDFLSAGETITLTYNIRVDNNFAPLDEYTTIPVTITITGTNDRPVITTSAQTIAFSGGTGTVGGPLTSSDPVKGTLSFTDVDLDDTHTVAVSKFTAVMSDGSILPEGPHTPFAFFEKALSLSLESDSTGTGTGSIDWQLAQLPAYLADFIPKDETLTLTYTVTVTDSQGATSDQTVTVDITGTGDKAVVWIHTVGDGSSDSAWTTAQNWETGTVPTASDDVIIITEQLLGLTPSYPVTIDQATLAFAHSLTMNDYSDYSGLKPPELDNSGSLTIGTTLSLSADAILRNFGTLSVGGKAEFLGHSSLVNSGQLTLQGGGDFTDSSSITNDADGTIEVAGGTLNVSVNVSNGGEIAVDAGASLALGGATIDGGTVTIAGLLFIHEGTLADYSSNDDAGSTPTPSTPVGNGVLDLKGSGVLQNGTLDNTGNIDVTGAANALHNENVINGGGIEVKAGGALLIDQGTTIANNVDGVVPPHQGEIFFPCGGVITVDGTASLTLSDAASIVGGRLVNFGTVFVEASIGATFDGVSVENTYGTIQVDCDFTPPVTLLLDDTTTITGGTLAIGAVGTLEIATAGGATLSGVTVDNSDLVQVDQGSKLTLDHSTITGGALHNSGTIDIETSATTTFDGVSVDNTHGTIQVDGDVAGPVTLLLDDATTITGGMLAIGAVGTLEISTEAGATLSGVTVDNAGLVQVDEGAVLALADGTIDNGTVSNDGTINATGTSAIDGADIANYGLIAVLSGTLTIDPGTLTNAARLQADGGELDIIGEQLDNTGTLAAIDGGTLKLTSTAVTGGGSVVIGAGSVLDLDHSGISAATLHNSGTLDNVAGDNIIAAAVVNDGGTIEVKAGTLDLAGGISGTGTLIIDAGATLEIAGADGQTFTFSGGTGTLELDVGSLPFTGTVAGQSVGGGHFTIGGAADITATSGDGIDFTASGGTHQSPAVIAVTPSGTITGAANGIKVVQNGVGDIAVDPAGAVTGLAGYGIIAEDSASGRGNIEVNAGGPVRGDGPGAAGLLVQNLNALNGGDIHVTATGGARGDAYGIDIRQNGDGDVTLESGGHVASVVQYGIRVRDFGAGNIFVKTDSGSIIDSGSSGIVAINRDTMISRGAESTITVDAHGTINAGGVANLGGSAPDGINAGYAGVGGSGTEANQSVNGDVIVKNHADINAAGGAGIDAYNFGNGDVTVKDKAGTHVVGATYGIIAEVESGGTGDVRVDISHDAMVTGTARYGILAYSLDAGSISVTTSHGDAITSGSSGIVAVDEATAIRHAVHSTITVTAQGSIHSGASLNNDGTAPAGIIAGYLPGGSRTVDGKVAGDVIVKSGAAILADAGFGILAYTYGTGDVSVTAGHASSIDVIGSGGIGIGAFAHDGGDVSVVNHGTVSATTGVSTFANGGGNIDIVNHGLIMGLGAYGIEAVDSGFGDIDITNGCTGTIVGTAAGILVHGNPFGSASIDNAGVIGSATMSGTTSAIDQDGGYIAIDNSGQINGNVDIACGTFTNACAGTWQFAGASVFGGGEIDNFGTIDLSGHAVLTGLHGLGIDDIGTIASLSGDNAIDGANLTIATTGILEVLGGRLTIDSHSVVTNFGKIEVAAGSALHIVGADVGTGEAILGARAVIEFGSYVSSGQTVSFAAPSGKLVIDSPWLFAAHIAGIAGSGDLLDLAGFNAGHDVVRASSGSFNAATDTTVLTVTDETTHKSVNLSLTGDYSDAAWSATSDGKGGADISMSHRAPVIETDKFTLTQNDDGTTTVSGLQVHDYDPSAATETFSLTARTGSESSSVSPSSGVGSLADINTDLHALTYHPAASDGPAPQTDQVNLTVADNFGGAETVHFIFNQSGESHVTLRGSSGNNVLVATGQSDTLIGGGHDQFVFKPTSGSGAVQHTVVDFNTQTDTIDLRQFENVSRWTDVHATQQGHDTLLTLDHDDSVLLKNVVAANLHASDFIVTPHSFG